MSWLPIHFRKRVAAAGAVIALPAVVWSTDLPAAAQYAFPPAVEPTRSAERMEQELLQATTQLEEATETIARLDEEDADLEVRLERLRQQLRMRTAALYRMKRAGILPVAGGFDAMLSHLARMERLGRIVQTDMEQVSSLRQRMNSLHNERDDARAALSVAQSDVDRMKAEQLRVAPLAFPLAAPAPSFAEAPGAGYGLHVRGQRDSFARLRGGLPLPVSVPGTIVDAQRDDGHGVEIGVPTTTPVRAVAAGRVAFARRYGRYGLMIVLDHGESFYSVYSSLGHLNVEAGDVLQTGASLGGAGGQPLYFEMRQGTRSVSAREWLGLD